MIVDLNGDTVLSVASVMVFTHRSLVKRAEVVDYRGTGVLADPPGLDVATSRELHQNRRKYWRPPQYEGLLLMVAGYCFRQFFSSISTETISAQLFHERCLYTFVEKNQPLNNLNDLQKRVKYRHVVFDIHSGRISGNLIAL